jgi:uncharacterized protein YbjT (DUF2867 family)
MSHILVTGATGNVGRELLRLLQAQGAPCRAAVSHIDRAKAALGDTTDCVRLDFTDPTTWAPALEGARRLFLVRPPAISDVVRHLNPFLDAAKASGVEHVVFLSLYGVNPVVPHWKVERHIRKIGLPYTFLRPGFFMQNLSTTHRRQIQERREFCLPAGRGRTNFIDARDIAAVAARCLTEPGHVGKAYPLTGSEALTYYEVAEVFSRVLGREFRYTNPSRGEFKRIMAADGFPPDYAAVVANLYTVVRFHLSAGLTLDVERILGRKPITLEQFVQDHAACWQ